MTEQHRLKVVVAWLVIALGVSIACQPVSAATPEGQLTIALPDFGNQVPVPWQEFAFGKSYMRLIYTALVGISDDGKLSTASGAAKKWELSEDGKTWTFWLRNNITFHNGDPLTAADVKFSLEKMMGKETVASYVGRLRSQIESVEVSDPYTVVIKTKTTATFLPWDLSDMQGTEGMIQPKGYTEQVGDEGFAKQPVGSGPYKVVERKHGDSITLEAVDHHWYEGVPKYKTVILKKVPEESTRIAMLKTGEADVISVSRERAPELKTAGLNVFTKSRWSVLGCFFHEQWQADTPWSKPQVRRALSLAINREELAEYVFAKSAVPAAVLPFTSRAPGVDPTLKPRPYDPEKAKALLKEAGYGDGFTIDFYSFPRADVPEMPRFIEAVAGYFGEIGIKTHIIPTEYASYRKKRMGFDLAGAMGCLAGPNRPVAALVSLMRLIVHSDGRFTSMKDPEMDRLVEQMEDAKSDAEGEAGLRAIFRYMYEHDNHLTVVEMDLPYATNARITKWNLGGAVWDQNFLDLIRQ